jgi:hypothetical protein
LIKMAVLMLSAMRYMRIEKQPLMRLVIEVMW